METIQILPNWHPNHSPAFTDARTLTFGIEFEMIAAYTHAWWDNFPDESMERVYNYLAKIHGQAGLPVYIPGSVIGYKKDQGRQPHEWVVTNDEAVSAAGDYDPEDIRAFYSRHTSKDGEEEYCTDSIEIVTGVLDYNAGSFLQVYKALEALAPLASGQIHPGFRLFLNKSCASHIHVGSKPSSWENLGFPLRTVKDMLQASFCFENQFDSIHPRFIVDDMWTKPISAFISSSEEIEAAETYQTLSKSKNLAINIENLICLDLNADMDWDASPDKHYYAEINSTKRSGIKTVEFRLHKGTVDAEETCQWAALVINLMAVCHKTATEGEGNFPPDFLSRGKDKTFTLADALKALDLAEVTQWYTPERLFCHCYIDLESEWWKPCGHCGGKRRVE